MFRLVEKYTRWGSYNGTIKEQDYRSHLQFYVLFTLLQTNLKTVFSPWNRIKCIKFRPLLSGQIWKRDSHHSFWICVSGKLVQENQTVIVTRLFWKSCIFTIFSFYTKTQSGRFQTFSRLKSIFEKLSFLDGLVCTLGLTGRNKQAAFF